MILYGDRREKMRGTEDISMNETKGRLTSQIEDTSEV